MSTLTETPAASAVSRAVTTEQLALYGAQVVAWVATLGSLYFSEVRHFVPCELCWFQRILMYPLALLIPLALLRRDNHLPLYTLVFSGLGIGVSSYHYLIQKTTWFAGAGTCDAGVPCSVAYINWFGFVTIPFLALIAFLSIFFLSTYAVTAARPVWPETGARPWLAVGGLILLVVLAFLPLYLGLG